MPDQAGLVFLQPDAEPRPDVQQGIVGDLGCAVTQDEQAPGGEGFQDRVDLFARGARVPNVQVGAAERPPGNRAVAAGGGQAGQDLPRERLLAGRQRIVDGVGAGLEDASGAACLAVAVAGQLGCHPDSPR